MKSYSRPSSRRISNSVLTPQDLIRLTLEHRGMTLAIIGIVFTLGLLYALFSRPIYESNILLQIEGASSSDAQALLARTSTTFFESKTATSAEIEVLRSRSVVETAVKNLRLDILAEPRRFPLVGHGVTRWRNRMTQGLETNYNNLWGYAWGRESIQVAELEVPDDLLEERMMLTAGADGMYELHVPGLERSTKAKVGELISIRAPAGLITIKVKELRGLAGTRYWLSKLSALKATEILQKDLALSEVGRLSGMIGVSLEGYSPKMITSTLTEIANAYLMQHVVRRSEEADKIMTFIERVLPSLKAELEKADKDLSEFLAQNGTPDFTETGRNLLSQIVTAQVNFNQLQQKKIEFSAIYTPNHPQMQVVAEQLESARSVVKHLQTQIQNLPRLEQRALNLVRNVKVNSEIYANLSTNVQQMRMLKESKVGKIRLIDPARLPEEPVKPKQLLIVMLSLLVGLIVSLITLVIRFAVGKGVLEADEIERTLNLVVCASVFHSLELDRLTKRRKSGQTRLLAVFDPYCPTVEDLRGLLTPLELQKVPNKPQRLLIAGPTAGVGKSFVSVNLAYLLASSQTGRTLLIDADLRQGHLNQFFGRTRGPGLSEVLSQSQSAHDLIIRDVYPGLDLLMAGAASQHPGNLMRSASSLAVFADLSSRYDHVVIDTPPILLVADAAGLAGAVDMVLIVANESKSTLRDVDMTARILQKAGAKQIEVVLNDIGLDGPAGKPYGRYEGYFKSTDTSPGAE